MRVSNTKITDIIFDIDGTISTNGQVLTPEIIFAIQKIIEKDINVVFATARPLRDTLPLLPQEFHHHLIIGCNGGMVARNAKVIHAKKISDDAAEFIINTLNKLKIPYVVDGVYNYTISKEICEFHHYIENKLGSKPETYDVIKREGITKILLLKLNDTIKTDVDRLLRKYEHSLTANLHKEEGFIDIVQGGTNKFYSAVEMGINFSHTAAFGNDSNDLLLLKNSQLAYVVGSNLIQHIDFAYTSIDSVTAVPEEILKLIEYLSL